MTIAALGNFAEMPSTGFLFEEEMTMTVLTAIRERFAGRRLDAESQYAKLVSDSAAGSDTDDATLASVLVATCRTQEQFIADVSRIERRAGAKLKLAEVVRLKPACEIACRATGEALTAVNDLRAKSQKLIADAMRIADEKSAISSGLQRQILDLEISASETLMATADPSLQSEIDQLEARYRDILEMQKSVGRTGCDPDEAIAEHRAFNSEVSRLQGRIEELQRQQSA